MLFRQTLATEEAERFLTLNIIGNRLEATLG